MTNTKKIVLGIVALAVVIAGVVVAQRSSVFGSSGPTHYQKESFIQGLYAGTGRQFEITNAGVFNTSAAVNLSGAVTLNSTEIHSAPVATSSAASATLLASDLSCDGSLVVSLPVSAVSLTLPASSTLATLLPTSGDWCNIEIVNASTTAAMTVTIVEGTGWKLSSTTNPVINPNGDGLLRIIRKPNSDFVGTLIKGSYAGVN